MIPGREEVRSGGGAFVRALVATVAFAFTNGFHHAATAIATPMATRGTRPGTASKWPKSVAKICDDAEELRTFFDFLLLLCQGSGSGRLLVGIDDGGVGQQRAVDHVGQPSLQGAHRLGRGVAARRPGRPR
jgi:hypothetical protein